MYRSEGRFFRPTLNYRVIFSGGINNCRGLDYVLACY